MIEVDAPKGLPFIIDGDRNKPQISANRITLVLVTVGADPAVRKTLMSAHGQPLGPDGTPVPTPAPEDYFKTPGRFDDAIHSSTLDRLPAEVVDQIVEVAHGLGVAGLRERIAHDKEYAAK